MVSVISRRVLIPSNPRFPIENLTPLKVYTRARVNNPLFSLARTHTRHISSTFTALDAAPRTGSAMDEAEAKGESTTGIDEWKSQPPYSIHKHVGSKNSDFKTIYEANCHCERVKYQLSRDAPLDSKLCHCSTCQTQHGRQDTSHIITEEEKS